MKFKVPKDKIVALVNDLVSVEDLEKSTGYCKTINIVYHRGEDDPYEVTVEFVKTEIMQ